MDLATVVAAVFMSVLVTAAFAALLWRRASSAQAAEIAQHMGAAREFEKQLHVKDRDALALRNQLEVSHGEAIRAAKLAAFEEGRLLGLAESNTIHVNDLSAQKNRLVTKLEAERDRAVTEARDKLRAEYELQTKLFTVKITPYVSITEDKGLLRASVETVTGYQYQLLVNGMPAFSPHVVAERTETKKATNPELERALLQTAERAADAAIQLYLGGSPQFAKLAAPVFERLTKK